MVTRSGFSMVEVLLAIALIGALVATGLPSITVGAGNAARAGEEQLAAGLAARTVDRLLMAGYQRLWFESEDEKEREIDLAVNGERPPAPGAIRPLIVDGVTFRGRYAVDRLGSDLLRLTLTISWERSGPAAAPARLFVTRYLADPALSLSVRAGSRGVE